MSPDQLLVAPFTDYAFMRRALLGCAALSLSAPPIGVFLMLRRMSLIGDAMSHAILPGVAIGYLVAGASLIAMSAGGFVAGLAVALTAGLVSRATSIKEDSSLAAFYLISLALGVILISLRGSPGDLVEVLFGTVLSLNDPALILIGIVATGSLLGLAVVYRPLVLECIDPVYLRTVSRAGPVAHVIFLALVVLNLVGGFSALGTLLAVGLMLLPAMVARLWVNDLKALMLLAVAIALTSSILGLLASFHFDLAAGPAIILAAGGAYAVSLFAAPRGMLSRRAAR
jgi:zinc/manganese transport system permease protein